MLGATIDTRVVPWTGERLETDAALVEDLSRVEVFAHLRRSLERRHQVALGFCNANMLLKAYGSASYAAALRKLVLINDGLGIDLCSLMIRGRRFRENLNGTDLIPALLDAETAERTLYLLGAKPGVAEAAARNLALRYPRHRVVGVRDGYFTVEETDAVIAAINAASPDILLVAMGNPGQEIFIAEHAYRIDARVLMGVGAFLDYTAGVAVRAPALVRRLRLEWLFRLVREPRRLGRRYTLDVALFLGLVVRLRVEMLVRAWADRGRGMSAPGS